MKKEKEDIEAKQLNWFQRNATHLFMMIFLIICFLGEAFIDLSDSLFQFALGAGLITWLIKSIGNQHFKKELELHKYQLSLRSQDYQAEIFLKSQDYQAELNKDLKKHELNLKLNGDKAINLYLKRIDVMSELYEKLSKAEYPLYAITRRVKSFDSTKSLNELEQRLITDFNKNFNDFAEYYEGKKIFFSKEICERLDDLQKEMAKISSDYRMKYKGDNHIFNKISYEACKRMDKDIPLILKDIEKEFRELLGVVECSK